MWELIQKEVRMHASNKVFMRLDTRDTQIKVKLKGKNFKGIRRTI